MAGANLSRSADGTPCHPLSVLAHRDVILESAIMRDPSLATFPAETFWVPWMAAATLS